MSLNLALGNAQSGLTATSRMAEVVAANLANALTEGYARRSVDLSAQSLDGRGAGVRVDGLSRQADRFLLADRRMAETALSDQRTRASALRSLERDLGSADAGTSLAARLQALEKALVAASAEPSSETRLSQVLDRFEGVASTLRGGAAAIQAHRTKADAAIASQVADLNANLQGLARLNGDIATALATDRDATGLLDVRQVLLDKVATMVPVRQMDRPGGAIALITPQGATLLDGPRATMVGFEASPVVTAEMSLASNGLSSLSLDGQLAETGGVGRLEGGSLGASFALRDSILPAAAARLDALARDLIERFADPATDATLSGGAGLLTDGGGILGPMGTVGLAGRIAVNTSVDPSQGGALWRLRDGVGPDVTSPGPAGESAQIVRWLDALDQPRALALGGPSRPAASLAADVEADLGSQRLAAEEAESFTNARWSTLREAELSHGVDSDQEMQMLLEIETAYVANAKVISALDAMMRTILEI